jgi:hypothetical protein
MLAIKVHQETCPDRLSLWADEVRVAFAHLSQPQIRGLVLWSAGVALSEAAGITQITALLALVLDQQEQAVFQRLREWYLDAKHKSEKKRRVLEAFFATGQVLASAKISASVVPLMSASSIARPLLPSTSVATAVSFTFAVSRTLWSRVTGFPPTLAPASSDNGSHLGVHGSGPEE